MLPSGPEMVPLGVFRIHTSAVDGVSLVTSISGEDRSRLVSRARFEEPYHIAAGTNYNDAIEAMISDGVSGLEFLFPSTSFTTPALTFDAQSDRWEAAQKMSKSIGNEILFDGLGRCLQRPTPTFSADPVATITEGFNLTDIGLTLDANDVYNRVIAESRNASTGETFRGVATDDDPASPTRYAGEFGQSPRFFYSEFIASDAQAESAAASILVGELGVPTRVQFSVVPDPRLECSDVVHMRRESLGIDSLHIIETLNMGLGPEDTMSGTTRAQVAA